MDIARGNGPCGAGQLAFAGEKFLVHRRAENRKPLAPLLDALEFFACHLACQEKVFGPFAEAFDHVLLGGIVIVTGRNGVAIDAKPGEELEHLLEFFDFSFFVDGRIGRDLKAKLLGHLDGLDAFFEDAFAFNDEIVGVLKAVDVHVPVHPPGGANHRAAIVFAFADRVQILVGDQVLGEQL